MRTLRCWLTFFAGLALILPWFVIYAQTPRPDVLAERSVDNRNRIERNEKSIQDIRKDTADKLSTINERLARLETRTELNQTLLIAIFIAVGMMVIETAMRLLGSRAVKQAEAK